MKKFWIVLLALGLVAGFAMSASAADVKFSGSYYIGGLYTDNPTLNKNQNTGTLVPGPQAFYYQRLRVQTEFKIAEGLNLVTRFDALERKWGDNNWRGTGDTYNRTANGATAASATGAFGAGVGAKVQENIEFERAYLDFTTKIGRFNIGYQNFVSWGTEMFNSDITRAGAKWFIPIGPVTVLLAIEKTYDNNDGVAVTGTSTNGIPGASDADNNVYDLGAIYKWGSGDAGIIWQKGVGRATRAVAAAPYGYRSDMNYLLPYARAKFGPVFVEGEALYGFGDLRKYDNTAAGSDVTAQGIGLYLHAKADIGPAYVGGKFVYLGGDDPTTTDKVEGSLANSLVAGDSFNPCLIMWNSEYTTWVGNIMSGAQSAATHTNPLTGAPNGQSTYMDNVWFYQVYGGFKPTPKIDIMASFSYAYADKKPWSYNSLLLTTAAAEYESNVYGTEIDLVAKYKIYDNLEYMLGAAYMFTGDLFKGVAGSGFVKADNYLLVNKLTLSF